MTGKDEAKIAKFKKRGQKVKREYEELVRKQDWALSEYLRTHDDSHLRAVEREIGECQKHLPQPDRPKERNSHPDSLGRHVGESALLDIQEDTLTALATGKLAREDLNAFIDGKIANLTIAKALDMFEGLATLDDEEAHAALVERMFNAAKRSKAGKRPVDVAGAALRLARILLTTHIASWACSIVDGTVPKPAIPPMGIPKRSAPTVPKRRG